MSILLRTMIFLSFLFFLFWKQFLLILKISRFSFGIFFLQKVDTIILCHSNVYQVQSKYNTVLISTFSSKYFTFLDSRCYPASTSHFDKKIWPLNWIDFFSWGLETNSPQNFAIFGFGIFLLQRVTLPFNVTQMFIKSPISLEWIQL